MELYNKLIGTWSRNLYLLFLFQNFCTLTVWFMKTVVTTSIVFIRPGFELLCSKANANNTRVSVKSQLCKSWKTLSYWPGLKNQVARQRISY